MRLRRRAEFLAVQMSGTELHGRQALAIRSGEPMGLRGWRVLAGYPVHRISASLPSAWMRVDRITCDSSAGRPTTTAPGPGPAPNSAVTGRTAVDTSSRGRVDLG